MGLVGLFVDKKAWRWCWSLEVELGQGNENVVYELPLQTREVRSVPRQTNELTSCSRSIPTTISCSLHLKPERLDRYLRQEDFSRPF